MTILVTGSAGFIGAALCLRLLEAGEQVVGIDNLDEYYDVDLKKARLNRLCQFKAYSHHNVSIANNHLMEKIWCDISPAIVINFAAQAGVRFSIENPQKYIDTNITGFNNILELSRRSGVKHLIFASSSSVYGANTKLPYSPSMAANHQLSPYAATKKSNEVMSHVYSHIYGLPVTGLRFFTVYGPWGRPDMAIFRFTKAIIENKKIEIFNDGNHMRDFTYIDDVVESIVQVMGMVPKGNLLWSGDHPDPSSSNAPWRIYNIGNGRPVKLLDFISSLERSLGKSAIKEYKKKQSGDVENTCCDGNDFFRDFNYSPSTNIQIGIDKFVEWYRDYYKF